LNGIVFEETHSEILFIDFNCETVANVLDGEILTNGTELADDLVVRSVFFVLGFEVVESFS
jgi:hypothetical protein